MAPFHHFFVFVCWSLPAIYTSGRVLHVLMTCFHANTEFRHRGNTYTWALAASCSVKVTRFQLLHVNVSQKNLMWMLKQRIAGGTWKPGELLPESGEEDRRLYRFWQWVWFCQRGRREADRSTVRDRRGERQSSCFFFFWNLLHQVRRKESCSALICSW